MKLPTGGGLTEITPHLDEGLIGIALIAEDDNCHVAIVLHPCAADLIYKNVYLLKRHPGREPIHLRVSYTARARRERRAGEPRKGLGVPYR